MKRRNSKPYEKGFKDGFRTALEKIVASLTKSDPEICLLYVMGWQDNGCCLNCRECMKAHSDEMGVIK